MSFPATFNISYYMGDTYEFRIFPKDASGAPFPLAQFPNVRFTIATQRGPLPESAPPRIQGYAEISIDRTSVLCSITPINAADIDASRQYVYDVEISRTASPYDQVFTLLTGNISITDQVTPVIVPTIQAPGPVGSTQVLSVTTSSITIGWVPPTTGGDPDEYKLYIIPYDETFENTIALTQLVALLPTLEPFTAEENTFTFTSTTAVPSLSIPSVPILPDTAYVYAVVSSNFSGDSSPVGNFDVSDGTIEEVLTLVEEP